MWKEIRRLHGMDFAVHLLRPKSKSPIESKWTTGPRKTLEELKSSYIHGMNIGVRLGKASPLPRGYLAVIDCDVKSREKKHLEQMEDKLFELFGEQLSEAPCVASGRGNGSKHYYVTMRPAATPRRLAQSFDKVEVHMPSVKASKADIERLSTLKIANGIRMRPAWEISLMGEGQQVVLPPSIHPDSGKHYIWSRPFLNAEDAPYIEIAGISKDTSPKAVSKDTKFEPEEVELQFSNLSGRIYKLITNGEGSSDDKSADLFSACLAMVKCGFTENQILSVCTDRRLFIGDVGFSHAKTNDRGVAAEWVRKYSLHKARREVSSASAFDAACEVETLEPEEARQQAEEIGEEIEETGFYDRGRNGALILDYDRLLKRFGKDHPYKTIADMGVVYAFRGTHYEDFTEIHLKAYAETVLEPKPTERMRTEFTSKVMANHVAMRSFFVESTEGFFNFKNGVLDLKDSSGGLLPHSPEFGFRGVLPYDYDPYAGCPFFRKWLRSIMLGDEALMAIIQEFMGYVVRGGEYKYHRALWLGGAGRNGKSTLVDIIKALIGHGNYSVISIKNLIQDRFAGSDLDGKLANFSEETSPQELADSGPFKNLTGDGELSVQKKFGDPYQIRNRAKVIMTYNVIPDLRDLTKGMLSRPLIVPFDKTIEQAEQDRNIKQKLLEELPGIFNFALEGWERLEAQGDFTYSARSAQAMKRVTEESCNVFQWVENNLEEGTEDAFIRSNQLYEYYKKAEKHPFRMIEFCRRLNTHPLMQGRLRHTREGNGYPGIKIP